GLLHRHRRRLALAGIARRRDQSPARHRRLRLVHRPARGHPRRGARRRLADLRLRDGDVPRRAARHLRRPARGRPRGRRLRVAGVPLRHPPAPAPDHAQRGHHPRPHQPQDLRPGGGDDWGRPRLPHRRPGAVHVRDDVPGEPLLPGRLDRDDHAAAGERPHHPLSRLQRPPRAAAMSATPAPVRVPAHARGRSLRPLRLLIYVVLVAFAIFYLLPIYVLVITGLKSFVEVSLDRIWNLTQTFSLQSFEDALFGSESSAIRGLAPNCLNSLLMTIPATVISAMLGSLNGYVLAKWKFPGANVL